MRSAVVSLFIIISHWVQGTAYPTPAEIWLDGASFYKSLPHKKGVTLFFSHWDPNVRPYLSDENYFVALQLDAGFDPFPEDDLSLPDLNSVAALSDTSVLIQYLTFLEQYGRTHGINYMVLPDTTGLSALQREAIAKASAHAPYYFLKSTFLSRQIPLTKKDFQREAAHAPLIWLTSQNQNVRRIRKWASKNIRHKERLFISSLKEAATSSHEPTYEMTPELKRDMVAKGTILIDPSQLLPIHTKKIAYAGPDEKLKRWLAQYESKRTEDQKDTLKVVDGRNTQNQPPQKDDLWITYRYNPVHAGPQLVLPVSYEGEEIEIGKMLFGGMEIPGRHPKARNLENSHFMTYSTLAHEGLMPDVEKKLDAIGASALSRYATPGIQVAVMKNGSLVLHKSYGFYTYDSLKSVSSKTRYDLASVTKAAATLPAIAYLIDQGKINLEDSVGKHLPAFVGSNKSAITVKELLAHQGGLKSYIPFWKMMKEDRLGAYFYETPQNEALAAYGAGPNPILLDTLRQYLIQSELSSQKGQYQYSDLGFMILHMMVEAVADQPFDVFMKQVFYDPMGLESLVFNPVSNGTPIESIAPTAYDEALRGYQIWGEVHDRNAAVFGGVAGHAGLFSTALDLSKMVYMMSNGGEYGGRRFLSKEVLNLFNTRHFTQNRRGLGWDKKDWDKDSASKHASDQSFGHTGFTGTMVWADPEEDLIFVFLSNRIFPDAQNERLSKYNIRTQMHDALYESLESFRVRNHLLNE